MTDTILRFFDACRPFGYPLLVCSVLLITAICYHAIFCGDRFLLRAMLRTCDSAHETETKRERLRALCLTYPHRALAQIMLYALAHGSETNAERLVEAKLQRYLDSERTGMAVISIITHISPMLGILGTAWGLVDIFGVFGSPGAEEGIAPGISKALYTTIFGLAIAVPGIIALTCFERGIERRATVINALFTEAMGR